VATALLAPAAAGAAPVRLVPVGTFAEPVFVGAPVGDTGRVFVVERAGRVVVVRAGASSVFLDVGDRVLAGSDQERGLLSVAFAPDFATSGTFYAYYTARDGALTISQFHASGDRADPGSEHVLVRIPHAQYANHNGGQLQIGPDGALYAGTGDGGGAGDPFGSGQDVGSRLGKLLRIDRASGSVAVWSRGLRNPWRFSFDRATGDLAVGDVGQDRYEEIDYVPRAQGWGLWANFGWSSWEGVHDFAGPRVSGTTFPLLEHGHSEGWCSITGGYVVRDPALPELAGRYVFSDFCKGDLVAATLGPGGARGEAATGLHVASPSSFGEDGCGRLYVASLTGPVYRLASSGACAGPAPAAGVLAPAPAAPGAVARDTRAPRLRLALARRQRALRRGYVAVGVRCDERCVVRARGEIVTRRRPARAAASRRLRTKPARRTLAPGARATLHLRIDQRTRARARRALRRGRRVLALVSLIATDRARNARRAHVRVRIVRSKRRQS
jgi:Glucose / Sorbosone dehydrogenase